MNTCMFLWGNYSQNMAHKTLTVLNTPSGDPGRKKYFTNILKCDFLLPLYWHCSDGVTSMMGYTVSTLAKLRRWYPPLPVITLSFIATHLSQVLDEAAKIINFTRSLPLSTRIFNNKNYAEIPSAACWHRMVVLKKSPCITEL